MRRPEYMPAPIALAHRLSRRLAEVRKSGELPWLRPDGKTQVSCSTERNGSIERLPAVVVSTQHAPEIPINELREAGQEAVIRPVLPPELIDPGYLGVY